MSNARKFTEGNQIQNGTHYFEMLEMILFVIFCVQPKPENAITIAVSSRVLFTMDLEQQIFEQKGMEEYLKYQIEHEMEPFAPGPAFPFIKVQIKVYNHSACCPC